MRLDILSSIPYLSVIPWFVAYLIKDNALYELCGNTLGILSFYSAQKKQLTIVDDQFIFVLPELKAVNFFCNKNKSNLFE